MPNNEHIFLEGYARSLKYTPLPSGGNPRFKARIRNQHAQNLTSEINNILIDIENLQNQSIITHNGLYFEFAGSIGFELITKSLENTKQGIRLLNVRQEETQNGIITYATVYLPFDKASFFLKKIRQFKDENLASGEPKNAPLIRSIEKIQNAVTKSFWTDILRTG